MNKFKLMKEKLYCGTNNNVDLFNDYLFSYKNIYILYILYFIKIHLIHLLRSVVMKNLFIKLIYVYFNLNMNNK